MDRDKILERIEKWKLLSEIFLNENLSVFIKEENGDVHFCNIISYNNEYVTIKNFGPEQRYGKTEKLYWLLIREFDKYEEKDRQ